MPPTRVVESALSTSTCAEIRRNTSSKSVLPHCSILHFAWKLIPADPCRTFLDGHARRNSPSRTSAWDVRDGNGASSRELPYAASLVLRDIGLSYSYSFGSHKLSITPFALALSCTHNETISKASKMGLLPQYRGRTLYRLMKIVCGASFMMYGVSPPTLRHCTLSPPLTALEYDAGVLGGVLLHPPFLSAMGHPTSTWTIPMITASYDLAAFITAIAISPFTFRLGRRGTIIMGNVVAVFGSVVQASSYSVAQIIVGRLLTGFSIGCISSAVPTYLSETGVDVGDRGPANAFNAILLISGVPLAYWIDYGFTHWYAQASWRIPIILQCVFAFFSGGTMWFLPDTPRWYYARNRFDEGDAVLARLNDAPVDSERVQETRREIMLAIESELEANSSLHWKDFLTMGIVDRTRMKIIRRLCMCFWLPMIREWMGSSLIAYYSTVILSTVTTPNLVTLIAGVLNTFFALGCVPLYFTIERVGRRTVLLYGAIVMTILITVFTGLVASSTSPTMDWAAVGIVFAFMFAFGYAWQGCVWLYCAEIAPLEYRHIGGAATAAGEWLMTFITVFAGPIGFDHIGWYFWLWVVSGNVVAIVFVFLLCPETGGKTLEQVDYLFVNKGFAGLQRNFDVGDEVMETWKEKEDIEAKEDQQNLACGGKDVLTFRVHLRPLWQVTMADPLSITTSVLAVLGAVTKLSIEIPKFVSDVRQATEDMASVQRELEAVSIPLARLKGCGESLPDELKLGLDSVLGSTKSEVEKLALLVKESRSGRGKSIRWIVTGKGEVDKRRACLGAHRSTLSLTLSLANLAMSADIRNDTNQILTAIHQLKVEAPAGAKGLILQRYLDATTTYAESVFEGTVIWSDAAEQPEHEVMTASSNASCDDESSGSQNLPPLTKIYQVQQPEIVDSVDTDSPIMPPSSTSVSYVPATFREAIRKNDEEQVKRLISRGLHVDTVEDHLTPLMHAAFLSRPRIVQQLLGFKASVNKRDIRGRHALCHALDGTRCNDRDRTVIELLIDAGADPDYQASELHNTALMQFFDDASNNDRSVVDEYHMLQTYIMAFDHRRVGDMNLQDKFGHTVLHLAVLSKKIDLVWPILDWRTRDKPIDMSLRDKKGRTAIDIVRQLESECPEMATLFCDYGYTV
ncbi:hypothetical protein EJ04DRAFT_557195 [Polyplosphaeria fusca]|uniref:Major facilitator superfamily (MFS) profile domain-containing protein n=1 Tax=Polyplosphaeria fusca TaxID=682080 RepID=A0A9P4QJQ2_9PLEO|nr:hypothetical protein EJ04DRAFT_557195 [Polyplosphaeria fusca]